MKRQSPRYTRAREAYLEDELGLETEQQEAAEYFDVDEGLYDDDLERDDIDYRGFDEVEYE